MTALPHKQVEATATPTIEKGTAVLLVAAYTKDRGGDVIQRGAFKSTIAAWVKSGKQLPLAWNHDTGEPERLIGTVDPRSLKETRDGLLAEAHLDLDGSETAREVWRLVKSDRVGVSFGYLVIEQEDADDDVRLLKAIDLFEVSLTASPMNGDTRVVSWKSAATDASASSEGIRTATTDDEFRELKATWDRLNRQRHEEVRRERELEQMIEEIKAGPRRKRNKPRGHGQDLLHRVTAKRSGRDSGTGPLL